jgi:SAM-dependent methyltransferase
MEIDLVQIHHAAYQDDLAFWASLVRNRDPVLEVGCGHGRVTLPLLNSGSRVVGVDLDRTALAYLRQSLGDLPGEDRERIRLVEGDILDFQPEESFGAVIIPCNTISTFSPDSRASLFQKSYSVLGENGLLAASLPNPVQLLEQLADLEGDNELSEPELETVLIHPQSGNPIQVSSRISAVTREPAALRWDWIYDQLTPDGRVNRKTASTVHFPILAEAYRDQLAQAGFRSTSLSGDFDGSPYSEESPYLILTASK